MIKKTFKFLKYSRKQAVGALFLMLFVLLSNATQTSTWVGFTIALMGVSIRIWAAGYINKRSLLTTAGPYSYTRNPLYFGTFLIGCGLSVASNNVFLFALYLVVYTLIYNEVMRREDTFLEQQFGSEYVGYKYSVPLFLPHLSSRGIPNDAEIHYSWSRALSLKQNAELETLIGTLVMGSLYYVLLTCSDPFFIKKMALGFAILFLIGRGVYYYHRAKKETSEP